MLLRRAVGGLLVGTTLVVAVVAGSLVASVAGSKPAAAFSRQFYAPYVDTSSNLSILAASQASGTKFFTLAFIIEGGSCQAMWNGNTPINGGFYQSEVSGLRAQGGDVIVSFGGAAGIELAQSCQSASALQAQYQAVIDAYSLTRVDFDVEGAAGADPVSIDRRDKALAGLEATARSRGRQLTVSYTLPVLPSGLVQDGINLLQNAVKNGVDVG